MCRPYTPTHAAQLSACLESHQPSGLRWYDEFFFSLPLPLLPLLGGGVYPLPLHSPMGLDGAPREALERPRWPKIAPRGSQGRKMASEIAQDTSRWVKIASDIPPKGPKAAPRRIQVPFEPSTAPSKRHTSIKHLGKPMYFAFSPFRFRWASEASRWLQDGPREPQEGPKRAPRRPQDRPRSLQERSKTAPRRNLSASEGGGLNIRTPLF